MTTNNDEASKAAVAKLDVLTDADAEDAHREADAIIVLYLQSLGPPHAQVAEAWDRAKDRIGFWYS